MAEKVLSPIQVKRLIIFLNSNSDPLGAGWNILRSKDAIGSGGVIGNGFLQGIQSHKGYLPEQSTDFIFSILSEEWGFVGGLVIFLLYFTVLVRCIILLRNTTNTYGYYITTGIFTMFTFHFMINVGMVMGIMPVTGITLPLMSGGGTSVIATLMGLGVVLNIGINSKSIRF